MPLPPRTHDALIPASDLDGWRLGLIGMPWPGPWPKSCGDLFAVAPNGDVAGLAWESTGPDLVQLIGPTPQRWGVFRVRFPFPVSSEADLIRNFHAVLPLLKAAHAAYRAAAG